jgi:hypothetical protein
MCMRVSCMHIVRVLTPWCHLVVSVPYESDSGESVRSDGEDDGCFVCGDDEECKRLKILRTWKTGWRCTSSGDRVRRERVIPRSENCYYARPGRDTALLGAPRCPFGPLKVFTADDNDVCYEVCMLKRDYQLCIIINVPSVMHCARAFMQKYEWVAVTMSQGTASGVAGSSIGDPERRGSRCPDAFAVGILCNKAERAKIDSRRRLPSPAYT